MPNAPIPEVGQEAPDFRLRGAGGAPYMLSEYRGEKNVLVIFYPLAFSPTCSHQLAEVQAALPRIESADAVVFGVSVDSHYANAAFARALGVGFPLLSDQKRETAAAYGVFIPEAGYSGRASFLVDKQGRIAWREVSELSGRLDDIPSLEQALTVLTLLAKG